VPSKNQKLTTKDKNPLHICFLTHEYPMTGRAQGGIGSMVQTLGRALCERGIKVSVVGVMNGIDQEIHEQNEGVDVWRLPAAKWPAGNFIPNSRRLVTKLHQIHAKNPIDIIEGSELSFAFIPGSFPAKKVIRMHGGHHFFAVTLGKKPAPWRSFQERRSFAKADALIAVSDYVGRTTKELLGLDSAFTTIYNLVDTTEFYEADRSKVVPGKLLFVGTVTEKKGVRQLVQAMPEILEAFPDATLEIVGRDWFDPQTGASYTEYLKTFIGEDIEHAVKIVGPLPHTEIPKQLEEAEVCVYPSHMEAQGLVVAEAMSMGKAIVFSKFGPGPEMIKDLESGLLCDPLDPSDIAKKIIYMLQHPKEAASMGINARKDILNRFNPGKIVQQNIDFYRALI